MSASMSKPLRLLIARLLGIVAFNSAALVYMPANASWWSPLAVGAACYMLADLWAVMTVGRD